MIDEAVFIEETFRSNFSSDEKLVIYGLGKHTKSILEKCPEYNIVGLMDKVRTGESEWGLPIISIDEVNELGVKKIVILATSANVPIIYRRIEDKCKYYGIEVYDINGDQKKPSDGEYTLDSFYSLCTDASLKKKIDESDIVSFDIFDTLLVRDVLYPTDIFEIVERKNKDFLLIDFAKVRMSCERRLYTTKNPNIYDIYEEIKRETEMDDALVKRLLDSEIEEEHKSLKARQGMRDIVHYAIQRGKKVCCTSDMYLTKEILANILRDNGYTTFDNIFISCEYGVAKNNGLFEIVKKSYPHQRILHIGDNYEADIVSAKRYGIDETFQISSIYRMLADGVSHKMIYHDVKLNDRCELGKLFSNLYNHPFLFAETNGKCKVMDNYSLGYYFIEPLLAAFMEWMLDYCQKDNIDILLLGARDGWVIQKMLELREEYKKSNICYRYLYASRYACTLAGMKNEDDVLYAFKMAFDGTPEEMLRKRFNLDESEIFHRMDYETSEQYLVRHTEKILEKSKMYREKYKKYLGQCELETKKVGFFDFVSSGTCQLWLENIYPEAEWTGYYFIKNLDVYKEKLDIKSYFEPRYVYEKQSKLYKNYIFMENIMTSFEPTFLGFTDEGGLVFEEESRSNIQLKILEDIHRGILDAYKDRLKSGGYVPSRELADDILDILNSEYSVMQASFFEGNILEDSFCNRTFDLKKMVGA